MTIHAMTILGVLLSGALPPADEPAGVPNSEESADASIAAGSEARVESGLKVAVDPVTGQIITKPTEADIEVLAEGVRIERRRPSWELRSFRLERGGEGVFLDGWADHALVVRVGADGTLHATCAAGDDHGKDLDETVVPDSTGENLR